MTALGLALAAAYGTYLLYTAVALRWQGIGPGPVVRSGRGWSRRLAVPGVAHRQLALASAATGLFAGAVTFGLFGGLLPALAAAVFAASAPFVTARSLRERAVADAREAWPRLIEEIRLKTGALGRSIPQALFDVGRSAPDELSAAFAEAEREWLLSTDFHRTITALKAGLADATADATLETLLVAHQVGGSDLDARLASLVEDRIQDIQGRKDARAKQAGVRLWITRHRLPRHVRHDGGAVGPPDGSLINAGRAQHHEVDRPVSRSEEGFSGLHDHPGKRERAQQRLGCHHLDRPGVGRRDWPSPPQRSMVQGHTRRR